LLAYLAGNIGGVCNTTIYPVVAINLGSIDISEQKSLTRVHLNFCDKKNDPRPLETYIAKRDSQCGQHNAAALTWAKFGTLMQRELVRDTPTMKRGAPL
jgi:hypothetical protein